MRISSLPPVRLEMCSRAERMEAAFVGSSWSVSIPVAESSFIDATDREAANTWRPDGLADEPCFCLY